MRIEAVQADGVMAGHAGEAAEQPGCGGMRLTPGPMATCGFLGAMVLALLLAAAPVHAAEPPAPAKGAAPAKAGTLGKAAGQSAAAPSGEPMLTRDELRQCLRQEDELKAGNSRLVDEQSAIDAEAKELSQAETALKAEREGIDATSAEAVAGFNARLVALRERADAYRSRALAFNEGVNAHQARHKVWVGDCGGRSYDEIDYFAIQRGK
jgi:hypothetical protein